MRQRHQCHFDWTRFTEDNFESMMKEKSNDIYGCVSLNILGEKYVIDIAYETKGSSDRNGISIEAYTSSDGVYHDIPIAIAGDKAIKSARKYERFCKRVEDIVLKSL